MWERAAGEGEGAATAGPTKGCAMSLTRDRGKVVFECDRCGEALETEEKDFDAAREKLTAEGWLTRKHGKDWCHYCGELCKNEADDEER